MQAARCAACTRPMRVGGERWAPARPACAGVCYEYWLGYRQILIEGTERLIQAKTARREAGFSDCTVRRSTSSPSQAAGRKLCFQGLPPALPSLQTNFSSSPAGQTVCELLLPVHRASNTGNLSISRVAWDRHELPIPQPCVARSRSRGPNRRGTAACLLQVSSTLPRILPVTGGAGGG